MGLAAREADVARLKGVAESARAESAAARTGLEEAAAQSADQVRSGARQTLAAP